MFKIVSESFLMEYKTNVETNCHTPVALMQNDL